MRKRVTEGPRNSGRWTEARFRSFIFSTLRAASRRWGPIEDAKRAANVGRGLYLCGMCKKDIPVTVKVGRARKNNIVVDHIQPIVSTEDGFTTWEDYINRMFCETDNLQVLCLDCHKEKSMQERADMAFHRKIRKERQDGSV